MIGELIQRSLLVALSATAIAGVLGVVMAGVLVRTRSPWRELVEALLTAPMVLPPTVLGWLLLVMLGRQSTIGRAIEALFGSPLVFSPAALVVAATIGALPFVVKSTGAACDDVDPRLIGAARTLGAPPWRVFVQIELPLARNGILAGLSLGFARALGDFGVTLMLAGNIPGHTQTASLAIYDAVVAGDDDRAWSLALVLTGIGLAALVLGGALGRRRPRGF